ncbi:MAG: hypothetical protein EHM37_17325 [Deltaproteobacteria bacterium]|nr:MAG: hypothetical protein EHM37_24040 [Deltaproteobacteria bacterium]RPJ07943.1 MAG: hypothetical protein EHM37_17325 [Deltaproteobacteria bacterium]
MNTLSSAVAHATALAYQADADMIVGRIEDSWVIADREDIGRLTQMTRPMFIVHSWGWEATEILDSMEDAGIDGDQNWENDTTTYQIDGETLIVNARRW